MDHMTYVGFNNSFANTLLFEEEEGHSQDPPAIIVEKKTKDIGTIISTTYQHKQRERVVNERSTHSPNVS